jgi:hypothetical protein
MQEINAQLALQLHQATGEPLAHCSYLIGQTNGDYDTAYKILERIIQQRREQAIDDDLSGAEDVVLDDVPTLEERVTRLEQQLAQLGGNLEIMSRQLGLLLDKLS